MQLAVRDFIFWQREEGAKGGLQIVSMPACNAARATAHLSGRLLEVRIRLTAPQRHRGRRRKATKVLPQNDLHVNGALGPVLLAYRSCVMANGR